MTSVALGDRVAMVTGGATGIGAAVCERLAEAGVGAVVINYASSADDAEKVATSLRERGVKALAVQADISDTSAVDAMFDLVLQRFGRLDYLVNNAGVTELIPFSDLGQVSRDTWDHLLGTNIVGTFQCARAAAPLLTKTFGAIVNVGSIAATRGIGSSIPYGVSKAGVLQLTRSLAIALAPAVRVNSVSAGTVRTSWHAKLVGAEVFEERSVAEAGTVPLGRLADARDIAAAVVSLLMLEFVTGQDLLVDGGKSLRYA